MVSKYKICYLQKMLSKLDSLTYKVAADEVHILLQELHKINTLLDSPKYSTFDELIRDCIIRKGRQYHKVTISCCHQGEYLRDSFCNLLMHGYEPIDPEKGQEHVLMGVMKEIFEDNQNCLSGNFKAKRSAIEQFESTSSLYYYTDDLFTPLYSHAGMQLVAENATVCTKKLKNGWRYSFEPQYAFTLEHVCGFSFSVNLGRWIMRNVNLLKKTGLNHMSLFLWMLNKKDDFAVRV